jgi:hypothetical protein
LAPLAGAGFFAWFAVSADGVGDSVDTIGRVLTTLCAISMLLGTVALIRGYGFAPATRRGALAASLGICNVCGSDLALTGRRHADGCTVCERCGASWRAAEDTGRPVEGVQALPVADPQTATDPAYDRA